VLRWKGISYHVQKKRRRWGPAKNRDGPSKNYDWRNFLRSILVARVAEDSTVIIGRREDQRSQASDVISRNCESALLGV